MAGDNRYDKGLHVHLDDAASFGGRSKHTLEIRLFERNMSHSTKPQFAFYAM